ncbi:MAG TPA: hypothetical protein VFZ64_04030 [Nocardioidaceae bacterium]
MTRVDGAEAHAALDRVVGAVAHASGAGGEGQGDILDGLAALQELRAQLLLWEPTLIEAAREQGVSWARLAPALGVTTRQAAERRYLRLRPSEAEGLTREQRVRATRDERAGDRAVSAWARDNASELRRIAGQVSSVSGLSRSGRRRARTLATSLTDDDPASLIEPLADMHPDLVADHTGLAEQVDEVGRQVRRVRRETQRRRGASAQS